MDLRATVTPPPGPTQPAKLVASLKGHSDTVSALAFTSDRCLLASAGRDGTVRIWDIASSRPGERAVIRKTSDNLRALAFSPKNRVLAVGAASLSGLSWLYDLSEKSPQEMTTLRGGLGTVGALAISPDSKLVAGAGTDHTLRVWEPGTGFKGDPRTLLLGHTKPPSALVFAPDGLSLASAGPDNTARTWTLSRIRSSQRALFPHPAEVDCIAYSPDGKSLATGCRDGIIRVWDATAIKPTVRVELPAPTGGARVLLVPDAVTLVAVGDGTRVPNWDLRTGKLAREWEVTGPAATGVALTPDGRYLARGTEHGAVELYRVAEKRA